MRADDLRPLMWNFRPPLAGRPPSERLADALTPILTDGEHPRVIVDRVRQGAVGPTLIAVLTERRLLLLPSGRRLDKHPSPITERPVDDLDVSPGDGMSAGQIFTKDGVYVAEIPRGTGSREWVHAIREAIYGQIPVVESVENIEVRTDSQLGRLYQVVGPIQARVTAGAAWNKARTVEDVNSKLRELALKKGANAVIDVRYSRGVSATSWKALTASGTAVIAESSEKKCPYCAEMIKREAKVCRFCGRDVEPDDGDSQI